MKKKLKDKVVIYNPKVKIEKFYKKKLISKEFNILGDYIFCFNPKFANQKILYVMYAYLIMNVKNSYKLNKILNQHIRVQIEKLEEKLLNTL